MNAVNKQRWSFSKKKTARANSSKEEAAGSRNLPRDQNSIDNLISGLNSCKLRKDVALQSPGRWGKKPDFLLLSTRMRGKISS